MMAGAPAEHGEARGRDSAPRRVSLAAALSLPAALTAVAVVATAGCSHAAPCAMADAGAGAGRDAAFDGPFDLPPGLAMTVPLTGCGGPGYAALFDIGTQTFELTVDTGSGTLAVASSACSSCGVTPGYTPGPGATDEGRRASDHYVAGSWQGEVYSDSVHLAGTSATATMSLAAIDSQTAFFGGGGCGLGTVPFAPQGIVGFGPADLAVQGTDAFLPKVTQTSAIPGVFAVELCSQGGQLMLGGVDPVAGALSGPAAYTPMIASPYYGVELDDLQLGGASLGYGAADFGAAAVDTGTSVLALPSAVFRALASTIESSAVFETAFGGMTSWLGTTMCLTSTLGPADLDSQLPTMTLVFPAPDGSKTALTRTATTSYLSPTAANGKTYYCSGIFENPVATGTIFGTSAMIGQMVIFDVDGRRIGFAPQTFCP